MQHLIENVCKKSKSVSFEPIQQKFTNIQKLFCHSNECVKNSKTWEVHSIRCDHEKPTKLENKIQFFYVFVFGAWIGLMDSEERNEFRATVTTFYQLDGEEGIPNVVQNFTKSGVSQPKSTPAE